jgi:hypothetical protein
MKTNMKSIFKFGALAIAMLGLATSASYAQDGKPKFSIGVETGFPVGKFGDVYDWNLGGSLQADIPVADKLYATVNSGFNNFFLNDDFNGKDLQLIPAKAGLKYFPVENFYVQAEAGASFLLNKTDAGATKTASFVYAPQVGIQFPVSDKSYIDAGVRFESNTKFVDNGKSNNFLGLRLAYAFDLR